MLASPQIRSIPVLPSISLGLIAIAFLAQIIAVFLGSEYTGWVVATIAWLTMAAFFICNLVFCLIERKYKKNTYIYVCLYAIFHFATTFNLILCWLTL